MIDEMVDPYFVALKEFTDEQLRTAYELTVNECKYFPKPVEIRQRVKGIEAESNENFEIRKDRCRTCGEYRLCIDEPIGEKQWRYRQCYTGLTVSEHKERLRDLYTMMGDKTYRPDWVNQLKADA